MSLSSRPLGLLAELTHACPLHCPYCSNPLVVSKPGKALSTAAWDSAIGQAAEMGVLQCSLSGGEPLLFKDLDRLITTARREGLYTNLITSSVGLTAARAVSLKDAGLDNVQISFQADSAELGDSIAGARVHQAKLDAARHVTDAGLNLSVNVVLHRFSIERIGPLADLAASLGANRVELAHVQFYGWAFENRRLLLPTRGQIRLADEAIVKIKERYRGAMEVLYVGSDYFEARPKPCMGGWGARFLTIDPDGFVLPCPTARSIPGMRFDNVSDTTLKSIWEGSEAFQRFRGDQWMEEPCRTCEFKTADFGGCRCQAALLTGNAAATDPICRLSPRRTEIDALLEEAGGDLSEAKFRTAPLRGS